VCGLQNKLNNALIGNISFPPYLRETGQTEKLQLMQKFEQSSLNYDIQNNRGGLKTDR